MIPTAYITQWREYAPWGFDEQVEQDLILSRILIEIFSDPFLSQELAFRGGTALHKLFLTPSARYSEDIDLVRTNTGPIGKVIHGIRSKLDQWLGSPVTKRNQGIFALYYHFEADATLKIPMRVKIEINTRENCSAFPLQTQVFSINSLWFNEKTEIITYSLEELLGTKLRAFFQRKKSRDLFDLALVLERFPELSPAKVIQSFEHYITLQKLHITRAEFERNLYMKLQDKMFINDLKPVLPTDALFDPNKAAALVHEILIKQLPGSPWKRNEELMFLFSNSDEL